MANASNIYALIASAGQGSRLQGAIPKQYQDLCGKPLLAHSLETLSTCRAIAGIQVVINPDDQNLYEKAALGIAKLLPLVAGGKTRQESIFFGLRALAKHNPTHVLIHDAARPNLHPDDLHKLLDLLVRQENSGVSLGIKSQDSLHRCDGNGKALENLNREGLWQAQTPQGFPFRQILEAHEKAAAQKLSFSDDIACGLHFGLKTTMLQGQGGNFKITLPQDLDRARKDKESSMTVKSAFGYDVHGFADGDKIILGGVGIPFHRKLDGHSDADVVLHALTDALLGCCGAGDIGQHFPPQDQRWKNADSKIFVDFAVKQLRQSGGEINNIDATILAEDPKIGPYRAAMQESIAKILGIEIRNVNIKATTSEGLGFIGRKEGIAAYVMVTASFRASAC